VNCYLTVPSSDLHATGHETWQLQQAHQSMETITDIACSHYASAPLTSRPVKFSPEVVRHQIFVIDTTLKRYFATRTS